MGAKVSKHSNKREAKVLTSNVRSSSQGSSIIEAIKPKCLKKKKMKKSEMKRQLQSPEKRITKVRKLTLEDWLLASPGPAGMHPTCLNEGEFRAFKHFSTSTRVHPSSSRQYESVPSTQVDSSSVDLSSGDVSHSPFSRGQRGKLKKKVSFRSPEEADTLIFYSPTEAFGSNQESF